MHPLHTDLPRPAVLNNPFCYEPDPLCLLAAEELKAYLRTRTDWQAEIAEGKMFGVLVCEDPQGQLGFLAAYSGQIGGREDWPWFVPAVFDYLQPDGYFKREEADISAINNRIAALESADDYVSAKAALAQLQAEAASSIEAYRTFMREAKARRHSHTPGSPVALTVPDGSPVGNPSSLIRESQFQKAELRRLKKRWQARLTEAERPVAATADELLRLRQERKRRSDALQRWLFDHFQMLNAQGECRSLTAIFRDTPQQLPPSGSGECCAPKLLQYAFQHRLHPLCMAEFWQGRSPKMEIRHHDHFYPACRGKCKPILEWMLNRKTLPRKTLPRPLPVREGSIYSQELDLITPLPHREGSGESLPFLVISKPSGLLSVPGTSDAPSVESILREHYGEVFMVHRLDMDTSGLMVVALTPEAYHHLQRQFLARTIYKRYIALLDGPLDPMIPASGTITLPLRPDLDDRPRQLVDYVHGKPAVTDYEVLSYENGRTRIALTPHTGRTHQLRMHCAHADGLSTPIVGDNLYGTPADRLYLHAETLSFDHPITNERLTFRQPPAF